MSIRNRIFLLFAIVMMLAAFGLYHWMRTDLKPHFLGAQEDTLVDLSRLLAARIELSALDGSNGHINVVALERLFSRLEQQRFDAQVYEVNKTRVNLRVYVTNAQGLVLFDSDHGRATGKDYSRWHDVALTLRGQYGARSTDDLAFYTGGSTMYIAAPIRLQGDIIGVVSVGKPTRNAERFLQVAIQRFGITAIGIVLLALVIALLLYAWLSRPLLLLHQYAKDLQSGRRVPAPKLGNNEIGRVGRSMTELQRALDGKTYIEQYVQSLTHELKSPTAAIAGAAELLAEEVPAEDRQRFVANISREAARLRALIERMLELAEIENCASLEAPVELNVSSLIDEALASLSAALEKKQLQVQRQEEARVTLAGDALLLHRALVNLLDNAIDFSPTGGRIGISVEADEQTLTIRIEDAGEGIPDYAHARVFERFYSLPRADGRKGTGLGLSFVRQIAALHGGDIRLYPLAGGGTCAELRLKR